MNSWINKVLSASSKLLWLSSKCAIRAFRAGVQDFPSTDVVSERCNALRYGTRGSRYRGNPAQDTALFDVELVSPLPYAPIGDGIIPIQVTLSGSFELADLSATVTVEGITGVFP